MGTSDKGLEATGYTGLGGKKADKGIIAGIPLITNLPQASHFTKVETRILKSGKFIITDLLLVKPRPKQRYQFPIIYTSLRELLKSKILREVR